MNDAAWRIPLAIFLASCSALFSGLTLGLMTLDVTQLKILIDAGEAEGPTGDKTLIENAKYASRIYPVRKNGNLLLVTLLVGNVMVNSAFSILMGNITSGAVGFAISTVIITIFGEIIPQAVCSKYGLIIGFYCIPLVRVIQVVLYIVAKPISMVLNFFLGEDIGTTYNRKQLSALVEHYQTDAKILGAEAKILAGGLLFAHKEVEKAMTPLSSVFGLDKDCRVDFRTISLIVEAGFSRIPVFDSTKDQCIVGLVLLKDLLLIDPESDVPLTSVISVIGRVVYAVDSDAECLSLLNDFKRGRTHMAVVRKVVECEDRDPYWKHVGVITLEDILEEILQDEILDETEVDNPQQQPSPGQEDSASVSEENEVLHAEPQEGDNMTGAYSQILSRPRLPRERLFEQRRNSIQLSANEVSAITHFLVSTATPFSKEIVNQSTVYAVVSSATLMVTKQTTMIFEKDVAPLKCVLILQGSAHLEIDAGCETVAGPWTLLGKDALLQGGELYKPSFSLRFQASVQHAGYFPSSGKENDNGRAKNELTFRALVISRDSYLYFVEKDNVENQV